MSEKEILDKIEKSAAQEKIPESIEPEQIKRKLKENQKNKVKRRSGITYYGAVAAHLCLSLAQQEESTRLPGAAQGL